LIKKSKKIDNFSDPKNPKNGEVRALPVRNRLKIKVPKFDVVVFISASKRQYKKN